MKSNLLILDLLAGYGYIFFGLCPHIVQISGPPLALLAMISTRLIGRKISPTEVSNANKGLIDVVEKWTTRDLFEETIKYVFLDGVTFDMRIDGRIGKVPVLVAIGVTKTGKKLVQRE